MEFKKAWDGFMNTMDLLSLSISQTELFSLKEACKMADVSIYEVYSEGWKKPMCGFSPVIKNGQPLWTERQVHVWAIAVESDSEMLKGYYRSLIAGEDENISRGVLSELISLIVKQELPQFLRDLVDDYVREMELVIA